MHARPCPRCSSLDHLVCARGRSMILVFGTGTREDPAEPGWQVSIATPAWEPRPEHSRFERIAHRFRRHPPGVRRRG
jgi:hypothetical protein